MKNLIINKILWMAILALSMVAAVAGVVEPDIYSKVMEEKLIVQAIAQDFLTIIVVVGTTWTAWKTKKTDTKKQIIILGVVGSLGYLYSIFSMERMYNWFYLVYLAIMGLCLYSIPLSIGGIDMKTEWKLPEWMRWIGVIFSIAIAVLFGVLWVSALLPVMESGQKIELFYSIYILDLVWIMPGFLIVAILSALKKTSGLLLTPAMYILGIFVIFPLGLGEVAKAYFGIEADDVKLMIMSFTLAGLFLVGATGQLLLLKTQCIRTKE